MPYALRDSAYCLFELLNGWSRDKKTDGRVPVAAAFATGLGMEHPRKRVTAIIEALVGVGLLVRDAEELVIPKYGKWQDTREEIERFSAAGRAGGRASGESRKGASGEAHVNDSFSDDATIRSASAERIVDDRSSQTETETEVGSFASLKNPPPDPPPNGSLAEGYEAFLATLSSATSRRFRGDAVSRGLYADRRREGRSADDLEAAARGAPLSAHHAGLNKLQVPLTDPKHVLGSGMLDALIGLGRGEIGVTRAETAEERRGREWGEALERHGEARMSELQA